jgi:hypothetical protein
MNVVVKWGRETIHTECDPDQPVSDFMSKIEAFTAVPIANQKLAMRKALIKLSDKFDPSQIKAALNFF